MTITISKSIKALYNVIKNHNMTSTYFPINQIKQFRR